MDDTFVDSPAGQRRAYDAIMAYLQSLGPVHEDAVQVGVFLKRQRKFAEIRPTSRALCLNLVLPRTVQDTRVLRTTRISADRFLHVIRLGDAPEVDEQVREWLTEAFLAAGADSG